MSKFLERFFSGRKRSRSSKDRSSPPPPPPQNSADRLGFCRKVLRKVLHSKKLVEEKLCRTPTVLPDFGWEPNPAFQSLQILHFSVPKARGNVPENRRHARHAPPIERKQKAGFVKGRFWRMYPRSGFWYRGTSACTLIPVFGTGEHPNIPSSNFGTGEHVSKPPFWKLPLCEPPNLVA